MRKNILYLFFVTICFGSIHNLHSQVKVGDNPTAIDNSSVLEVESTNKAFVPPRMTTVQMNAILNPLVGAVVYNITEDCLFNYTTKGWLSTCNELGIQLVLQKTSDKFLATNQIDRVSFSSTPTVNTDNCISWNGSNAFTVNKKGIYAVRI